MERRTRHIVWSICAVSAVILAALVVYLTPKATAHGDKDTGDAAIGGTFSLSDPSGKPVTDADFRGKYMLIYFGFTSCPDICPTTLQNVSQAMASLSAEGRRVAPLFISVDPERDTPAQMAAYMQNFPGILGLTGTPAQVRQVTDAYKVYYGKEQDASNPVGYTVGHSSFLYVMGPDGRYLAHLPHTASAAEIAAALHAHLSPDS